MCMQWYLFFGMSCTMFKRIIYDDVSVATILVSSLTPLNPAFTCFTILSLTSLHKVQQYLAFNFLVSSYMANG